MKSVTESWTSVSPEERSILTANRVNVQNQKFKKELALKQRGLDDEMKCDNVIHSRKEHAMQNRLSRLNMATNFKSNSRMGTPFSSASSDNWLLKSDRASSSNQENVSTVSRSSMDSLARTYKENSNTRDHVSSSRTRCDSISVTRTESEQRTDRHVRFGKSSSGAKNDSSDSKGSSSRRRISLDLGGTMGYRGSRDTPDDTGSSSTSNALPGIDKHISKQYLSAKSSGSLVKGTHGFSSPSLGRLINLTPRNSLKATSGLEEEMARWRRLHHTRTINARIKAVRGGGKRHSSCSTLREAMDHAAMLRKEEALHPEPFTPERAWGLLNCGYLRLTPSNIATLEEICGNAGYDVRSHPHKSNDDAWTDMQGVFEELRESRRLQPDVPSQIKFRQSLLFKRLSDFNTS